MVPVQVPDAGSAACAAPELIRQGAPLALAEAGRSRRENNFDILRLALAILVIFSHSYPLGTGSEASEPLHVASRGQLTLGFLAVGGFFAMSGYLITQSWVNSRTVWSYLKKRIYRIYPGFIAAMAVAAWMVTPLVSPDSLRVFTPSYVLHFVLNSVRLIRCPMPPIFLANPTPNEINGSVWSIPFEFRCYIGVMFLGLASLLSRRRIVLCLFALVVAGNLYLEMTGWYPTGGFLGRIFGAPYRWAGILPLYLSGVLFYLYRDRLVINTRGALLCLGGFALAAVLPHGMVLAQPTLVTYLLFYLAFSRKLPRYDAGTHGDFSYGVYLYAFPIQQIIMFAFGHPVSPWLLFALALPPSLVVGAISWYAVERRFLSRAHRAPAN